MSKYTDFLSCEDPKKKFVTKFGAVRMHKLKPFPLLKATKGGREILNILGVGTK